MSSPTPQDATAARLPEQRAFRRIFRLLPGFIALLAMIGILLLILSDQAEHVSAVAAFGTAVLFGDAVANVTIILRS